MKDKNIFVNIVYFVIGALIVLVMGELSEICIDLKQLLMILDMTI